MDSIEEYRNKWFAWVDQQEEENVGYCWFYRITDIVSKATKGKYTIKKNE